MTKIPYYAIIIISLVAGFMAYQVFQNERASQEVASTVLGIPYSLLVTACLTLALLTHLIGKIKYVFFLPVILLIVLGILGLTGAVDCTPLAFGLNLCVLALGSGATLLGLGGFRTLLGK